MKNQESKVLDKIRKLFALAESDNENESALALAKAKELMAKFDIKSDDLVISNIKESIAKTSRGKVPPDYLVLLGQGIAKLFECEMFNVAQRDRKGWQGNFVFVGFSPNQEVCSYTFSVLAEKLKKQRKSYMKSIKGQNQIPKRGDAYAKGWSNAVFKKVLELVPKPEINLFDERGLVKKETMLKKHVKNKVTGAISGKKSARSSMDELAGMNDGEKVEIHKGMNRSDNLMLGKG